MAEQRSNQRGSFDDFIFGRRQAEADVSEQENQEENKEDTSFDLIDTTETVMETYRQLSPYVKELSSLFKRFTS